jgi:uncharacterized protein
MAYTAIQDMHVRRGQGVALNLRQGQLIRITQPGPGGQVVDLTVLNAENHHERLWGSKTAWEHGVHLTTGAVLLSTGPWERPLMTITADTLSREPTANGTLFHDVMAGCCSSKSHVRRYGLDPTLLGCFEVIAGALASFGVPPDFVQDVFNPFMRTGVLENRLFHEPSDAAEGDYVELRAEMDVLVAMSCCQGRSSKADSNGVLVAVLNS